MMRGPLSASLPFYAPPRSTDWLVRCIEVLAYQRAAIACADHRLLHPPIAGPGVACQPRPTRVPTLASASRSPATTRRAMARGTHRARWRSSHSRRARSRAGAERAPFLFHLDGEQSRVGEVTLVATKVCGDVHVPAGATTFYVPLCYMGPQPVMPQGGVLGVAPLAGSVPWLRLLGTARLPQPQLRGTGACTA